MKARRNPYNLESVADRRHRVPLRLTVHQEKVQRDMTVIVHDPSSARCARDRMCRA